MNKKIKYYSIFTPILDVLMTPVLVSCIVVFILEIKTDPELIFTSVFFLIMGIAFYSVSIIVRLKFIFILDDEDFLLNKTSKYKNILYITAFIPLINIFVTNIMAYKIIKFEKNKSNKDLN